jgi:signal recognition particle subunit SRP9
VIKVTDDTTVTLVSPFSFPSLSQAESSTLGFSRKHKKCIKFKTRSTVYLNRFDAFNRALMNRFQNRNDKPSTRDEPVEAGAVAASTVGIRTEGGDESKEAEQTGGTGGGSAAKKKKKGKKKSKAA